MKYFVSVYSPHRNARRVFLMNSESAKRLYGAYLRNFPEIHRTRCLKEGAEIRSPDNDSLFIWGENIGDSEIFKRRLNGSVDKETLES
jgi:hypothetical protein